MTKLAAQWTHFYDMHSGGSLKLKWAHIFIEAPEDEARIIFYNRFDRNPERVTCTCCGEDYSISEHESLEQATAYLRNCAFAYFRPNGTECPESEGWKSGEGTTPGYTSRYVERASTARWARGKHQTLGAALKTGQLAGAMLEKTFLVVRAKDIKPKERRGEEGYVWQG